MRRNARSSPKFVKKPCSSWYRRCRLPFLLVLVLACDGVLAAAQKSSRGPVAPAKITAREPESELAARAQVARASRASGDPVEVDRANRLLLATGLRELADLRSVEGAYEEAIELYRRSLAFEDSVASRLGLATASTQAGHYDDAIKLAEEVRVADPKNIRADRVLGSSLVQKGEFAQAVPAFERVAESEPTIANEYALVNCLLQTRTPESKVRADAAIREMERTAGDGGSLHVLLGRAYRDAGDMNSAVREFETAIRIDPRTPHAHYFLGLAKLALNEWKPTPEAEGEMKKEVAYYPHDYLANYMVGFLESGERRYSEAKSYLEAAAVIDPRVPEPALYLGLNAYAQGDMATAETNLRKAVALTGNDEARSNYQIRRAYVDLGRILASSGRKDESEAFLTKARALQNKTMEQSQQSIASMAQASGAGASAAVVPLASPEPASHAGGTGDTAADATNAGMDKLTTAQKDEVKKQESLLRNVLGLSYSDLGTSEAIRGDYPDAFAHYQQAERWNSSLDGLAKNLGQSAFRAGEHAEAIRALTRAVREQPANPALRGMLGISYFNMDQYSKAAETFAPLGSRGAEDGEIGYAWAASLTHTGDLKRASEVLATFSGEPRPPEILLLVGQLWTAVGDYPKAISSLEQALKANASLRRAHLDEGLAYIRWEHWPEAAREFQAELALTPGDPDATYHLGYVAMQQSKMDEAVALYEKVVAEYPTYANAQYQLGKIYLDRGQVERAIGHLEAAAHASPQTDYIHYQLQAAYRKQNRTEQADQELAKYRQLKEASRERFAEASNATQHQVPH